MYLRRNLYFLLQSSKAQDEKYRPQLSIETVTKHTHTSITFPKGISSYATERPAHIYTLPTASQHQDISVNSTPETRAYKNLSSHLNSLQSWNMVDSMGMFMLSTYTGGIIGIALEQHTDEQKALIWKADCGQ